MKSRSILIVLFAVLLSLLLFGCDSSETELTSTNIDAVLVFSEDKTDALLSAMDNNDYAAFSQDFDADMQNALPQAHFAALKKYRDARLGLYISRKVWSVVLVGDFYAMINTAKLGKDDNVVVHVVFHMVEPR